MSQNSINTKIDGLLSELRSESAKRRESTIRKIEQSDVRDDRIVEELTYLAVRDSVPYVRAAATEKLSSFGLEVDASRISNVSTSSDTQSQKTDLNAPEKWEVKNSMGIQLTALDESEIEQGLKQGWIRPEDMIKKGRTNWQPVQSKMSSSTFSIQALIDTPRAYAKQFAKYVGGGGAILSLLVVPTLLGVTNPIRTVGAIIAILIMVGAIQRAWKAGSWFLLAGAWLIGSYTVYLITGIEDVVPFYFILITLAVLGLVVGAGIGFGIGWLVGKSRQDRFKIPNTRQPIPDAVVTAHSVPSQLEQRQGEGVVEAKKVA